MAITLRTVKGTALTYEEVDRNFSQYFYSASVEGTNLQLWYTGSSQLSLPGGEDYSARIGTSVNLSPAIGEAIKTRPEGIEGSIQYKKGIEFAGSEVYIANNSIGIGTATPGAQLDIASTLNIPARLRLSALLPPLPTSVDPGYKAALEFYRGTGASIAEIGLSTTSDRSLYINSTPTTLAGIKFGVGPNIKAYVSSTGFGVTAGTFPVNVVPNQALTVVGAIGVGNSVTDTDQSTIRQQESVRSELLPDSANTTGLLIESQKGSLGGNIIIGLNSTSNNNESFSIIRGLKGSYSRAVATFKADGNVGIGTVNPKSILHIAKNGNANGGSMLLGGETSNSTKWGVVTSTNYNNVTYPSGIGVVAGVSTNTGNSIYVGGGINELNSANAINFYTTDQSTIGAGTIRMKITSDGNVGIGTDTPGIYKLNVNGTSNLGGNTSITGDLSITGTTSLTGGLTVPGILSATNIIGTSKSGIGNSTLYTHGGIITATPSNSTIGPSVGFSRPGTPGYGSSLQLTADGEFKLWKQNGTTLANISASLFVGELVGNAATATNAGKLDNIDSTGFARVHKGSVNISSAAFTNAFNVTGDALASAIRFTVRGTADSVVVNVMADLLVNHSEDIVLTTTAGIYTILSVRVQSNGGERYSVLMSTNSATPANLYVEVFPLNSEGVTFAGTATTGVTLNHIAHPGIHTSATGGNSGDLRAGGTVTAPSFVGELVGNASTARSIKIGSNDSISNLDLALTDTGTVRFDTFSLSALNKPVNSNNANGVITFAMNHATQYGKQIAFADNDDLYIRRLTSNTYHSWYRLLHSGNFNSYALPLAGGTMTGNIEFTDPGVGGKRGIQGTLSDNDYWFVGGGSAASDQGYLEIATADNGTEPIYVRQYTGIFTSLTRTATLLDASGNTFFPGTLSAGSDIIAYSSSDKKLKENVVPIKNAIKKIKQISGYTFDWNDKQDIYTGHDIGVIAQEIEKVLPEVVVTRDNGFKAVKYEKIVPLLIECIKEQQTQIDELSKLVKQLIQK